MFCGVGGGTTKGIRTVSLAKDVECQGAMGVVLNAPISDLNLLAVVKAVDIPVIITVTKEDTDIEARLRAGASILNVAAGPRTPDVVRLIREKNPQVPIIASGGKTGESIRQTIAAGANAITFTPPSTQELFKEMIGSHMLKLSYHTNFTEGDHISHEQEYNTRDGVSAIADEVCREIRR